MNSVFGGPYRVFDDTRNPGAEPVQYAEYVRTTLTQLKPRDAGVVRIRRPKPTAAFSPLDTVHAHYQRARELVQARGFTPVERGTGGRLTIFDEGALGITIIAPHADPHGHMIKRYELFASALVSGLCALGIDAHVGELTNEYCPGKFSINAGKRVKLVGVAQRMRRQAFQMGAVVSVRRSERACAAIADAYGAMALPFDAGTYGGINDFLPGVTFEEAAASLLASVESMLE